MDDKLNTGIECVLFDLDGTLIDTAADFRQVLDQMLDEQELPRITPERIHQTVSDGARALVSLAFGLTDRDPDFEPLLQKLLDRYYEQLDNTLAQPYPGILALLEKLEKATIPWGVVTNKPEKYSLRLLQQLQLLDRCGSLVCPEHVQQRKPDPESLLLACRQLNRNYERTVYIGDHLRDMQAARNADIIAVAAAYGYLGADTRIEEWPADFIIRSAADLEPLLTLLQFA
ncbi:MAG: HAD-IA family hydrolase [Gammaproteobacteria bacterium]|nr:HAD-IA family hydrolase [Pseudomonadales bacterium]MCP5345872.1 HAD-IA family hydrolase [Pseudomonadales bacterium]